MAAYSHFTELGLTRRLPNARARVDAPVAHDGGSDRRWIADEGGTETYLGTLVRMVFRPTRFALDWTQGAKAISPLKFVAVTTTIVAVTTQLVQDGETSTTWLALVNSLTPTLVYAFLGVLIHTVFKGVRSQRSVETSLGLTLYTIAGPGLFFPLSLILLLWVAKGHTTEKAGIWLQHQALWLKLSVIASSLALYLWPRLVLGRVLHAVHRRRWWWTLLAIVLAELALAVVFGAMEQFGIRYAVYFGWPRLVIKPNLHSYGIYW